MAIKLEIKKCIRHYRKKGDAVSKDHEFYCLARQADHFWLYTLDDIAKDVVNATSLTKADITHAYECLATEVKKHLVHGNRVKINGLGTFYLGVSSESAEKPEDLSVRSVQRVYINFLPDMALKLVNNATAITRSDSNVMFSIAGREDEEPTTGGANPGGNNPGSGGTGGTGGDEDLDPEA